FNHSTPHTLVTLVLVILCQRAHRPPSATLFPYTTLFRSRTSTSSAHRRRHTNRSTCARTWIRSRTSGCAAPSPCAWTGRSWCRRSEEHTSELQSRENLVCRLLLEKKKKNVSTSTLLFRW